MLAIVIGTFTSRAPLYSQEGIWNGGAEAVEPVGGGYNVRGSSLGGKVKRDELGEENSTPANAILITTWTSSLLVLSNGSKYSGNILI